MFEVMESCVSGEVNLGVQDCMLLPLLNCLT